MCERIELPGIGVAIVCGGHRVLKRCAYPECRARATVECDHPSTAGKTKTCDRATCRAHAKPIAPNVDWCWRCAQAEARHAG